MKPEFWQAKWDAGQIGFHLDSVHPELLETADSVFSGGPHRVLVPLCGKSLDVSWLAQQGHTVVGVELAPSAVAALFEEAGLTPHYTDIPGGRRATAGDITVLQGDLFELDLASAGPFDRIWDRAALVALHPEQRQAYAQALKSALAADGQMLLNVLTYDPSISDGPPWSIDADTVRSLYPSAVHLRTRDALDERWKKAGHTFFDSTSWWIRNDS